MKPDAGVQPRSRQNQNQKTGSTQLAAMLSENFPQENRENIERLMNEASVFVNRARVYMKQNPGEAAGLAMTAGAVLWALFGTKPGRQALEIGSAAAMPVVSGWITKNFNQQIH